jgi:iron complex transport system ATP-binding protein
VLLQAVELTFGYGRARRARPRAGPAIGGVSLEVARGSLLGILGPNGSGKTTLLRLLAGTLAADGGQVLLDGVDLRRISRAVLARRFAVVPQETQLAFEYTALEIALMGRYPHLGAFEIEGPDDLESALSSLDATGTRHLADRRFQTLSGGEKQRVVIASALAQLDPGRATFINASGAPPPLARAPAFEDSLRPPQRGCRVGDPGASRGPRALPQAPGRILLLDEPTASLDLRYQIEIGALIRRLHDRQDVSIVLTTHDVHFARAVCDEIVLLRAGEMLARGPAADVLTIARLNELYGIDVSPALKEAFV